MQSVREIILQHHSDNALHHAYLIVADPEAVRSDLDGVFADILGAPPRGHPDFWSHTCEFLRIEDSHALRSAQANTGFGPRRVFCLEAYSVGAEATDALLKILEDAPEGRHFFLITPRADTLLPTLRSRMYRIDMREGEDADGSEQGSRALLSKAAQEFLSSPVATRMKVIEKYLPKKSATQEEKKVCKRELVSFVRTVACELHDRKPVKEATDSLASLQMVLGYLDDTGAATRLLAEHAALAPSA